MTISGIASGFSARPHQSNPLGQDWQALSKALASGDLEGAKTAFAKLQSDMQTSRARHTNALGQAKQTSLADQAVAAIGKALAAGDVAGAQKAYSDFQQQVQTMRQSQAHTYTSASPSYNDHDQDDGQTASAASSSSATGVDLTKLLTDSLNITA